MLTTKLQELIGNDYVLTDSSSCAFYSTDLSYQQQSHIASIVVRPGTVEELVACVKAAAIAEFNVVTRGGGMSYTGGYTPAKENTMLIDMLRLDQVLEVNSEDMYVVVQCGCTWEKLYEVLQERGLRTPYFGPGSGKYATVGGALAQNSLFLGSGVYRTVAESVLGLQVVRADGAMITTGSGAYQNSGPFSRHFGPDVTGIFTGDTGAFGVKAVAVLRLVLHPPSTEYLSFEFDAVDRMIRAQSRLAHLGICAECYGFNPSFNSALESHEVTLTQATSIAGNVARKNGLFRAAQLAVGGRRSLRNLSYTLHITLDALTEVIAKEYRLMCASICTEEGGREVDSMIPSIFRAQPFEGIEKVLLGPQGEAWLPVHGVFSISGATAAAEKTEEWMAEKRPTLERYNIKTSYMTCLSGTEILIEPNFYWFDSLGEFRLSVIEGRHRKEWKDIPTDVVTRQVVLNLRDELRDIFDGLGATHLQIGKYYPYQDLMNNEPLWHTLNGLKDLLDPDRRVNPGALGLQ